MQDNSEFAMKDHSSYEWWREGEMKNGFDVHGQGKWQAAEYSHVRRIIIFLLKKC